MVIRHDQYHQEEAAEQIKSAARTHMILYNNLKVGLR